MNKKHIEEIFSTYGKVTGVYIPREETTDLNKDYAFIEFDSMESAELADLYMGGGQIDGLIVKTEILDPKNYKKL